MASAVLAVCITPLGSPVVPEVNTTSLTALGSVPASGRRPSRRSHAVSVSHAKDRMPSPGDPRTTKTSRSDGVSARSSTAMAAWS